MGGVSAKEDGPRFPDSKLDEVTDTTGEAWYSLNQHLPSGTRVLWFLLSLVFLSIFIDIVTT